MLSAGLAVAIEAKKDMGATLDLDDVAATSETARQELADLRDQVGAATNPRYLLWRLCQWDNVGPIYEYSLWIDARWDEWCKQANRPRNAHSKDDHAEFDMWLMRWARREVVKTSAFFAN